MIQNIHTIVKTQFNLPEIRALAEYTVGVCELDLFFIREYINYKGCKRVLEFGTGTSTVFLNNIGQRVDTFAVDCPVPGLNPEKYRNVSYNTLHIDDSNIDKFVNLSNDCDLIFIDADHSAKFAELYYTRLIEKIKKPCVIHDIFYTYNQPGAYKWGECEYLKSQLALETSLYNVIIHTDIPDQYTDDVSGMINYDVNQQRRGNNGYGATRPPTCTMFIEPKSI